MTSAHGQQRRTDRVVITGGAGFLGSHLVDRLLDEGSEVICLDNFCTGDENNLAAAHSSERFRFHSLDVARHELTAVVDGPVDAVLHFASPASPLDYLRLPLETMKVGSAGTEHALELARAKGARFLLASTSETYGDPQVHPQPETYWGHVNPVGPRGVYDEAKRYAEALTMAYRRTHAVDTAIARIFNTFGPRMRPRDGRAIPAFVTQALMGVPLTVAGDGSQTRSVCFVDDLVDGLLGLLRSGHSGPMNIGNPREMSILNLAELVVSLSGSASTLSFIARPEDDPTVRCPDISLAESVLGWSPQVKIEDGLIRTIEWFRAHPSLTAIGAASPS